MGVTTLKRKARRNSAKAEIRAQKMKLLIKKPVIKKVTIEDLKSQSSPVEKVVKKATKKATGTEEAE
jgi:hypothetical protein